MAKKTNSALAQEIGKLLKKDATLTVPDLAEKCKCKEEQVIRVLDAYTPDGKLAGTGKGHGWIAESE